MERPSPSWTSAPILYWMLLGGTIALTVYHVALTASTVLAFDLRAPFMDQFRGNLRHLTMPFPASVLELENGHRPVLPGIVRFVELRWLDGTQFLQMATAWLAAAVTIALILRPVLRDLRSRPELMASALCAVFVLLLWNANARMFIHSFEAVHLFYVLSLVVIAICAAMKGGTSGLQAWLVATGVCVAATFTLGPGFASFAAVGAVALLRRAQARMLILLALAAIVSFAIYYYALPGAEGVRGLTSKFDPSAIVLFSSARVGALFAEIVRPAAVDPILRLTGATAAGAVALALMATVVIRAWARRKPLSDTEVLALALFVFGVATNVLIVSARTPYFFQYPDQIFADRYVFWSDVTWVGILLFALSRLANASAARRALAAAGVLALAISAIPSAVQGNLWSAEVFRRTQLFAVAAQLGIRNEAELPDISDAGSEVTYRSIDVMRELKTSLFADRSTLRIGRRITLEPRSDVLTIPASATRSARNAPATAVLVSGTLPEKVALAERRSTLWFADSGGVLVGRAALTTAAYRPAALGLGVPPLLGFQGYLREESPPDLYLVGERDGVTRTLARLAVQP